MTGTDAGKAGRGEPPNPERNGVSVGEVASGGIQFAIILVLSAAAGMYLDRQLETSPWLLIVLVFLGAAVAFYTLYRKLMKGQRLGDRRKHAERRDESE
jgi:F0F1-type ATP synthase assembly protein I